MISKEYKVVEDNLNSIGISLKKDYDGFIVKELKASNTLDEGRTTNQTHIAITGEQMDLFPYIRAVGYFDNEYNNQDPNLKKYYVLQIPIYLHQDNLNYLGYGCNEYEKKVYASVVRSRRDGAADQIQMSMINLDSPDFVSFRKYCHTNDFLIILKRKSEVLYDFYAIKAENVSDELKKLNNHFYKESTNTVVKFDQVVQSNNTTNSLIGFNKIFYGIPGCGKSYKIDAMLNHKPKFVDEAIKNKIMTKAEESDVIRTTFYLDYSNSDFIGQIYPCVEKIEVKNDDGSTSYKSIVTYKRIPGPFTKALLRAYQHLIDKDNSQVYLIIEEINRGNAAAIFGDTFQLLDRKNGDSEYPINNEFIESYLRENLENIENLPSDYNLEKIIIPHNLTIFATMNTSDQNVFPLDTAFKRRWNRERITNDWENVGHIKDMYIPYTDIKWEIFAKTINKEMINQSIKKDAPISEDKQMGAYFANENMLTEGPMEKDEVKLNNFENNILDYLYNDVTKFDHSILFEKQLYSIDNIYERINLYIDAIKNTDNDTGAEQAESKCVFNNVFIDEITEQMLGFVTRADDSND